MLLRTKKINCLNSLSFITNEIYIKLRLLICDFEIGLVKSPDCDFLVFMNKWMCFSLYSNSNEQNSVEQNFTQYKSNKNF